MYFLNIIKVMIKIRPFNLKKALANRVIALEVDKNMQNHKQHLIKP